MILDKQYKNIQTYASKILAKQISDIIEIDCVSNYEISDNNSNVFSNEFKIHVKIPNGMRYIYHRFEFIRSDKALKMLSIDGVKDIKTYPFGLCFIFYNDFIFNDKFQKSIDTFAKSLKTHEKYKL